MVGSHSVGTHTGECLVCGTNIQLSRCQPSLTVGTLGTQSTFATDDSTRLTNSAGEIPFRRSGFDGRFETLAERNMRETSSPYAQRASGSPVVPMTLGPMFPPRVKVVKTAAETPAPSIPRKMQSPATVGLPRVPPKVTGSFSNAGTPSRLQTPPSVGTSVASNTLLKPNMSGMHFKYGMASTKSSRPISTDRASSTCRMPPRSAPVSASKPGSQKSIDVPSSYRNVFFGDKHSDSSSEDVEDAVVKQAVKHSSGEMPAEHVSGKPRLVAFTHERTPTSSGPPSQRNVSQRVVLQGGDDSDEAAMRIGLEYVRQLGHLESSHEVDRTNASSSHVSVAFDPPRTPSAEFYASNDSNDSIAGRTRVLAPLVISSHRHRHQGTHSMASTHDSFVSSVQREGPRESQQMVEVAQTPIGLVANEPFNFAAPLDSARDKHASALAGSALEARQADGRPLPEWLRFDKVQREFWGVPPRGNKDDNGATAVTRVKVKIWEGEKGDVVGGCMIEVRGTEEQ